MVRMYEPAVKTEYGFGMYSDDEYHTPVMKESPHGEWVKLETFQNEMKRMQAIIGRLKTQVNALQQKILDTNQNIVE